MGREGHLAPHSQPKPAASPEGVWWGHQQRPLLGTSLLSPSPQMLIGVWIHLKGCLEGGARLSSSSWGHLLFQASPPPQTPSPPPPSLLVNLLSTCVDRAAWETEEREGGQRILKTTDDLACAPPPIGSPTATTALKSQRGLVLAPPRWARGQGLGRASLGLHGPRNACSMTTLGQQDPRPHPQAAADSPLPPTGLTHSWGARGGAGGPCQ